VTSRGVALAGFLLVALPACKSSAPYTVPSAALNSAIAVGAAAARRSAGGCYADCVGGTVCNPKTGYCEKPIAVCVGSEADTLPCAGQAGTSTLQTQRPGLDPAAGAAPLPVGVSPATGTVPPPPGSPPPSLGRP
jgi:hypothetical protein